MKSILAILALTLTACGVNQPTHVPPVMDPVKIATPAPIPTVELETLVNEFYDLVKVHGIPHPEVMVVGFEFTDVKWNENSVGQCTSYFYQTGNKKVGVPGRNTIKFLSLFWDIAIDSVRKHLVFHEMFHCVLGLAHVKEENQVMSENLAPVHMITDAFFETAFRADHPKTWTMPKEEFGLTESDIFSVTID